MSINIKNLTVKNFMSVGNATQAIDFDRQDLTLVLGENLDLGGDGSRNGTGKTTILNALSYALFGLALTNIRRDNLINGTNNKAMLVSLEVEINGTEYRIERGRKPNILKLYVNSLEQNNSDDDAQGDSRETQKAIERIFGMSHDMFKHVLALNTYTEPFLALKANDQRTIIEQLLGITMLSEKAEKIKEQHKITKDKIAQENYKIKAIQDANEHVNTQITGMKRKQKMWLTKKEADIANLVSALEDLSHVDIDVEIENHKLLDEFFANNLLKTNVSNALHKSKVALTKEEMSVTKLSQEIKSLQENVCYACKQEIHDHTHKEILDSKTTLLNTSIAEVATLENECAQLQEALLNISDLGAAPAVYYDSLDSAYNHRTSVNTLASQLDSRTKDVDLYHEQIVEMEAKALQEISYDTLNKITKTYEHEEFLLKLLTNKDSFIRKKIIEQNLSYLNSRLEHYLSAIGLPHSVLFQNDLTVEIMELGRDLDFDNLSRGERNRLILSLSWAFRDVWESLYSPINLLFVDELIDSGMDTVGVENSLAILKAMARERNKSVWLVSHREELQGRVENVLKVIKEHGFTSYNTHVE